MADLIAFNNQADFDRVGRATKIVEGMQPPSPNNQRLGGVRGPHTAILRPLSEDVDGDGYQQVEIRAYWDHDAAAWVAYDPPIITHVKVGG